MEENIKGKKNEEEYKKELQDWLNISDKKFDVLFDNKLIEVFRQAVNKFGFEKTWDIFMKLQNFLKDVIMQKTYLNEATPANLIKIIDLINKKFGEHGYRKEDLLKSLKRLQVKLIEEYEKINSEKLKNCIEKINKKVDKKK